MWASQLSKIALSGGFSKCSLSFSLSVSISFEETVNGKLLTTKVSNCCQNVEVRPIPFSNIKDLSFLRLFRWSITLGALWVLVVGASGESVWATGTAGLLSNTSLAHLPTTLALLFLLIFKRNNFFSSQSTTRLQNVLKLSFFLHFSFHFNPFRLLILNVLAPSSNWGGKKLSLGLFISWLLQIELLT